MPLLGVCWVHPSSVSLAHLWQRAYGSEGSRSALTLPSGSPSPPGTQSEGEHLCGLFFWVGVSMPFFFFNVSMLLV
jgi:hypothetical protein